MNLFSSFSFASVAIALLLAGYALATLTRSRAGRLLVAMLSLEAAIVFAQGMASRTASTPQAIRWDDVLSLWPFVLALQLHVALDVSRVRRGVPAALALGYASAASVALLLIADVFGRAPKLGQWGFVARTGTAGAGWIGAWIVAISLCALVPTVRAWLWGTDRLTASRARTAALAMATYLVVGGLIDGSLFARGGDAQALSPVLFIFVALVVVIGVAKGYPVVMTDSAIAAEVLASMPDAVLFADPDGRVAYANQAAVRMLGAPIEELGGRPVADLIASQTTVLPCGSPSQVEGVVSSSSGEQVHVSTTWMPLRSRTGARVGSVYVLHDLTCRKNVETQLHQALSVKDAFLANVSHELRTPLNSILGFTVVILQGHAGPLTQEQRRQLRMAERAARQLLTMVDDMLEVSGSRRQPVTDREGVAVDAGELIRPVVALLAQRAHEKALALRIEEPLPDIRFVTDPGKAQQVLINLVDNAIKFTERGTITISATVSDGRIELSVRDTGMGIAPRDLPHVNREFHQLARPDGRKPDGAGLGLTISERYARSLHGELVARSRVGAGSTFTLRLPLEDVPVDSEPATG